jgi:hypothetical protein
MSRVGGARLSATRPHPSGPLSSAGAGAYSDGGRRRRRGRGSRMGGEDAYRRGLEILLTNAPTTREDELVPQLRSVIKHEAFALRRQRDRRLEAALARGPRAQRPRRSSPCGHRARSGWARGGRDGCNVSHGSGLLRVRLWPRWASNRARQRATYVAEAGPSMLARAVASVALKRRRPGRCGRPVAVVRQRDRARRVPRWPRRGGPGRPRRPGKRPPARRGARSCPAARGAAFQAT